jgi:hypothetical protein
VHGALANAADPGFTAASCTNHGGTQSVTEDTNAIVHLTTLPPDGPTGTFQDRYDLVLLPDPARRTAPDISDHDP